MSRRADERGDAPALVRGRGEEEADGREGGTSRSTKRDDRDSSRRPRSRSRSRERRSRRHRSRSGSARASVASSGSEDSRRSRRHRSHRSSRRHRHRSRSASEESDDRRRRHSSRRDRDRDREHRSSRDEHRSSRRARDTAADDPGRITSIAKPLVPTPAAPDYGPPTAGGLPRSKNESNAKLASMFGYSADENPYGDSNLFETFVWKKKLEKEITTGKRDRMPTRAELRADRDALMDEIERAKRRREEREAEREEMMRLRAEEARLRDASQLQDWERKEEEFHLRQVSERALLRIRENRCKPIDGIVKNMLLYKAVAGNDLDDTDFAWLGMSVELNDPVSIITTLPLETLRELSADVAEHADAAQLLGYDDVSTHSFWTALRVVTKEALARAEARRECLDSGGSLAAVLAVQDEIDSMFEGKSAQALAVMAAEVRGTIQRAMDASRARSSGHIASVGGVSHAAVDVEYWERVKQQLEVAQARLTLRAAHERVLQLRLEQMEPRAEEIDAAKAEQRAADAKLWSVSGVDEEKPYVADKSAPTEERLSALRRAGMLIASHTGGTDEAEPASAGAGGKTSAASRGDDTFVSESGIVLPTGADEADMPADAEVALPGVLPATSVEAPPAAAAATAAPMSADELAALHDRYRPRKPRFFNRVKTGYDWNKYNKTHYDRENPPPKVVQGYKFTIFYPDLLDRSATPSFRLEPADSDEFCIIRFHAGPPYEDVAFKIVNREWEYQRKHGFRCVFDRGALQLYFNFKKHFYRK